MACGNEVTWGCGPTTRMSPDPPGEMSALMELGRDCTRPQCPHHGHRLPTQSPLPTQATTALCRWVTHAAHDLGEAYF